MAGSRRKKPRKGVDTLTHPEAARRNIPTAEHSSVMVEDENEPVRVAFERRNRDLDPQLVWRGKNGHDVSEVVAPAPPLYIQEKVHPKILIDDLLRRSIEEAEKSPETPDLFDDFNGLPDGDARTEFYRHDANWSNRMILGDSLQVMASLAEREGLRGKVQCIYIDPPYGIKFNSNFQWSTTSRDVKDGNAAHITREPEQVKAFRDTWRDGIHSYLAYLHDRLVVARELLAESGSIFVQIGDENAHRIRTLMDEVFGEENAFANIVFKKKSFTARGHALNDYILHYAKRRDHAKWRDLYGAITVNDDFPDDKTYGRILTKYGNFVSPKDDAEALGLLAEGGKWCKSGDRVISQHVSKTRSNAICLQGRSISPGSNAQWAFDPGAGLPRLDRAGRLHLSNDGRLNALVFWDDVPRRRISNFWNDTTGAYRPTYVVQTATKVIQRCILMTTDPGDLVLDPTCGSGTTAYVAEQWGRRWITIDTSRVALTLARARIMGARYPWYLLRDSEAGVQKEAELRQVPPPGTDLSRVQQEGHRPDIRQGFVYERVPKITLGAIADNTEIDVIWEQMQPAVTNAIAELNAALQGHPEPHEVIVGGRAGERIDFTASGEVTLPSGEKAPAAGFMEWEVPREIPGGGGESDWPAAARDAHARFWEARIARQNAIDASIAAKADYEHLYDRPHEDNARVRVAGPFTVESLAPHRMLAVDENDGFVSAPDAGGHDSREAPDFTKMVLENLRTAGVQQAHKDDRIGFTSLAPWPGRYVCAEGHYVEGDEGTGATRRAGVFIGPEFGTVTRPDLVAAAKEAAEAGFDVLVACAFNYDAHSAEFDRLGRIPVLKARMNADLHMAEDLQKTDKANLFVVFGEPDIDILDEDDDGIRVRVNGVDVFHPSTGEVRSDGADGIACWFVDTDYNEESFFVRHAYFLGADDPYKALKTTLRAEIDPDAWATLNSDISRPFPRPESGRIAVKVINHLGDEAMKVFRV